MGKETQRTLNVMYHTRAQWAFLELEVPDYTYHTYYQGFSLDQAA